MAIYTARHSAKSRHEACFGLFANANKQQHIMCNDKTKYTSESLIPIDFVMDQWNGGHEHTNETWVGQSVCKSFD